VTVTAPGFRVKSFYLVTTLIDAQLYSATDLAVLYYQRWDVELYFRDIKTTMGTDILRCITPGTMKKEIVMHLIAYNTICLLTSEAAPAVERLPRRFSFKASFQAPRQWEPLFNRIDLKDLERQRLWSSPHDVIADAEFTKRPGRREPKCVNRRPKPYALRTAPRHAVKDLPHRGRYRAEKT
jgi:hypothetical protein